MTSLRRLTAVAIAASGLGACGGEHGTQAQETPTSAPLSGSPILIETRITNARRHTGAVLDGSVFGETPFCPGGKSTGGSEGATITTTFSCPGGTLTVRYAPAQRSFVQGAPWTVVSGTGDFEGLTGGGTMVARFDEDDPDAGGEIFTGDVGR
jgi:hypothetical protein